MREADTGRGRQSAEERGRGASEGAVPPRDRLRPRPYQFACMGSLIAWSEAASLAGSRRSPSRLRLSDDRSRSGRRSEPVIAGMSRQIIGTVW